MGDCQTILHYLSTVKLDKSIQWSTFYILLSFDHFIFISRFNSTGENNVGKHELKIYPIAHKIIIKSVFLILLDLQQNKI